MGTAELGELGRGWRRNEGLHGEKKAVDLASAGDSMGTSRLMPAEGKEDAVGSEMTSSNSWNNFSWRLKATFPVVPLKCHR